MPTLKTDLRQRRHLPRFTWRFAKDLSSCAISSKVRVPSFGSKESKPASKTETDQLAHPARSNTCHDSPHFSGRVFSKLPTSRPAPLVGRAPLFRDGALV